MKIPLNVNQPQQDGEDFRDHISTVDQDGKRKWIYPQKPKGVYFNKRAIVSLFYYLFFFITPFIHIKGRPLLMLNIPDGKFVIFGYIFWPHDYFIFGMIMLAGLLFIALFTMAFGRIFCGWICPQTVFMEMLFRRIDYWILGDAAKQKIYARSEWNSEKTTKYTIRYLLYFLMSFLIANTFLAYIIGIDELWKIVSSPVSEHIGGLSAILIFTAIFFGVFAFLREQVCTIICPYGRLQGVLLDSNSIVVAYDYKRGEPRGKFTKKTDNPFGDCIDCDQCVKVCPTGIDIRNGTQLECTNCTACIDACNFMMEKVGREQGLIRYDSENNIAKGLKFRFTSRLKVYSGILIVITIAIVGMLISRKDIDGDVLRASGMLFQERGNDSISNLYNIKLMNKTHKAVPLTLKIEQSEGRIEMVGKEGLTAKAEDQMNGTFFIVLPKSEIQDRKKTIKIGVYKGDEKILTKTTTFMGPIKRNQ